MVAKRLICTALFIAIKTRLQGQNRLQALHAPIHLQSKLALLAVLRCQVLLAFLSRSATIRFDVALSL